MKQKYVCFQRVIIIILLSQSLGVLAQNSLPAYIGQAILNSPFITDQRNQVKSLALDSIRILATLKPQLNLTGSGYFAPVVKGIGYDEVITNGQLVTGLVGINYSYQGKERLNNQFTSIQLQKKVLEIGEKIGVRDLEQSVTTQYITVYQDQQLLQNTQEILGIMQKEEHIFRSLTEQSVYAQADYLAFLSTLKQQEISVLQQTLVARSDLFLLKYICGITDTTYFELNQPELTLPPLFAIDHTLQYQQFHIDSLQNQNSLEQFDLTYKPRLNLFGDAGYTSSLTYQPYKNFGTSAGVNFTMPLYDGNQRRIQHQKYQLMEVTRTAYKESYIRQYAIKYGQLLNQIQNTDRIMVEAGKQVILARSLVDVNQTLLEAGSLKISDFLLSLSGLVTSHGSLKQLEASKMQLINQLIYLNY